MQTAFGTGFSEGEAGGEAGRAAAETALRESGANAVDFVVVFCSPTYDCEAVIDGVQSVTGDAKLIGATADGKFTERGVHTGSFMGGEGVTVTVVASDEMRFFTGLGHDASDDPAACIQEATASLPTAVDGFDHLTGIILTSSFFGREELVLRTYQEVPIEWAGGGAHDITLENNTVFVDDEVATDGVALTVIASAEPFALGVGNRHSPIGGAYKVTKSDGEVVYELDGRPAYEVWKEAFEDVARDQYGFSFAELESDPLLFNKAFTEMVFGLQTGANEYKVRGAWLTPFYEPYASYPTADDERPDDSPLENLPTFGTLPEGALMFPNPIPEGVVLHPMTSGKEGTIERGTKSARHALDDLEATDVAGALAFECPCGEMTLQEEYPKLIEAVVDPLDAPLSGIQSGGDEVCFRSDDMRGLHETATSLLLFPGGEAG